MDRPRHGARLLKSISETTLIANASVYTTESIQEQDTLRYTLRGESI